MCLPICSSAVGVADAVAEAVADAVADLSASTPASTAPPPPPHAAEIQGEEGAREGVTEGARGKGKKNKNQKKGASKAGGGREKAVHAAGGSGGGVSSMSFSSKIWRKAVPLHRQVLALLALQVQKCKKKKLTLLRHACTASAASLCRACLTTRPEDAGGEKKTGRRCWAMTEIRACLCSQITARRLAGMGVL